MIVVRHVFQAKYGKADELVAVFKEMRKWQPKIATRILTDLSGPFFTVVSEVEVESLAEWERMMHEMFKEPKFGEWFGRTTALTESGRREIYTLEG
jgi:hypothetical protein